MINYQFVSNEYISLFPLRKSNVIFFVFSYLVKEYKYGQNCTPLSKSDSRYFFLIAIIHGLRFRGGIITHKNTRNICLLLPDQQSNDFVVVNEIFRLLVRSLHCVQNSPSVFESCNSINAVLVGHYMYLSPLIFQVCPFSAIYAFGCTSGINCTGVP